MSAAPRSTRARRVTPSQADALADKAAASAVPIVRGDDDRRHHAEAGWAFYRALQDNPRATVAELIELAAANLERHAALMAETLLDPRWPYDAAYVEGMLRLAETVRGMGNE